MNYAKYDIIVIGLGPAGASAAIYAKRAGLSCVVFESGTPGGQISSTETVENYPGFKSITGWELATKFMEHAADCGADIKFEPVTEVDLKAKKVIAPSGCYTGSAIIICGGSRRRKLGLPNEDSLTGKGISYCAVCDGSFYRQKTVAVIGGGDSAVGDAVYLSRFCSDVYLIHRREQLRAARSLRSSLDASKVKKILNATVEAVNEEDGHVVSITVNESGNLKEISVDGVFVAIGSEPDTALYNGLELDKSGHIITNDDMETSVEGIYAAGDIRSKKIRQIINAASDGAIAAINAAERISEGND